MGRKKKDKNYFTLDTEEAIIAYNKCSDAIEREKIYRERIN